MNAPPLVIPANEYQQQEAVLPTPVLSILKRRRSYGQHKPSKMLVLHELQRLIKTNTRNKFKLSKNKLARYAGVDRHLIIRILKNEGVPDLAKVEAILRFLKHRLAVAPLHGDEQ